jgi:serine/threonine protein kinase
MWSRRSASKLLISKTTPSLCEYASPEQLRGEPITTSTHVYGLGVLLYALLSGAHPFAERAQSPVEMMRQICEFDPPPPGSITFKGAGPSNPSEDLDRIVLTAMQERPEGRYASATALARDVFAYLNGYRVFARGGGWSYRAGKFCAAPQAHGG